MVDLRDWPREHKRGPGSSEQYRGHPVDLGEGEVRELTRLAPAELPGRFGRGDNSNGVIELPGMSRREEQIADDAVQPKR